MQIVAQQPWYRQRWPWLLSIMPITAIIVGFAFLWAAIKTDDGLVADDYYKDGLAINRIVKRDVAASNYDVHATARLEGAVVSLQLTGKLPARPDSLKLSLVHPTRKGLDHSALLTRDRLDSYTGVVQGLIDSRFDVILEPINGSWRLAGVWHPTRGETLYLSPPQRSPRKG
jgi:uncharacterized protein